MTRPRIYGEDTPFGRWMRLHPDLDSRQIGLSVTDADFSIHSYKDNIDGEGGRTVQLMFDLEVKTRNARPPDWQKQTKFFEHQLLNQRRRLHCNLQHDIKSVWHFGQFFVFMDGEAPDTSTRIIWGRFDDKGRIGEHEISTGILVNVLRFDLRPDTLQPLSLRRHHKTHKIVEAFCWPLGFYDERILTRRS